MKKIHVIYTILLMLLPNWFLGTETKSLTENGFNSVWLWQLSNTTITEEKGLSLSQDTKQHYKTPRILWTGERVGDEFFLGTAESATIIKLDQNFEETIIYNDSDRSIVGAIAQDGDGILVAISPDSVLIHFDSDYKEVTNISFSNNYIWDIVPNGDGGFYILTGLNAEVYEYNNYTLSDPISLDNEEHLLEGLYIDNVLWVLGEKALYKKVGDNFVALASFQGTASSFTYTNNTFYVVQTVTKEISNGTSKEQVTSFLTSVTIDGVVDELYSLQGFYFTSIGVFNRNIVIGADQFGLYAFYDLVTKKSYYASLGDGKILDIFSENNQLFLLSSGISGLWSIDKQLTSEGSFVSEIYDTGNVSYWGIFTSKIETPPNTSVQFFIQSGVTENPLYWDEWQPITSGEKIDLPNARYIRYRAVLTSSEGAAPYVFEVKILYTQVNLPPVIKSITIDRKKQEIALSWVVTDPNEDKLEYNIYLAEDGLPRVKINSVPITTTNFSFTNRLFPSESMRIIFVANDRLSNSDKTALTTQHTSLPIQFDSENPIINDISITKLNNKVTISVIIEDVHSLLTMVSYFINGANEVFLSPNDGIYDSSKEIFTFDLPLNQPFFLQINAKDQANNISSKGITILPN